MCANRLNSRETAVRQRDRHQCQNCRKEAGSASALVVHQIVPAGHGGTDRLSNMVLLCEGCHEAAHRGADPAEARCR